MTDDALETALARCLVDPSFLRDVRDNPSAVLAQLGLEPETIEAFARADLTKIERLSGFIGKVQHNHLWEFFPTSRELLRHFGLEFQIFTAFRAVQHTEEWKSATREERVRKFWAFVLDDFKDQIPDNRALRAVVQHEAALWEFKGLRPIEAADRQADRQSVATDLPWSRLIRHIPYISQNSRIIRFETDPVALKTAVETHKYDKKSPRQPVVLLYQHDVHVSRCTVEEIDMMSALIFSQINGRRSIRIIIDRIRRDGFQDLPPVAFREFFETVHDREIIGLSPRPAG